MAGADSRPGGDRGHHATFHCPRLEPRFAVGGFLPRVDRRRHPVVDATARPSRCNRRGTVPDSPIHVNQRELCDRVNCRTDRHVLEPVRSDDYSRAVSGRWFGNYDLRCVLRRTHWRPDAVSRERHIARPARFRRVGECSPTATDYCDLHLDRRIGRRAVSQRVVVGPTVLRASLSEHISLRQRVLQRGVLADGHR